MKKQAKSKKSKIPKFDLSIIPRDSLMVFQTHDPANLARALLDFKKEAAERNITGVILHKAMEVDLYSFTDEELLACGMVRISEARLNEH